MTWKTGAFVTALLGSSANAADWREFSADNGTVYRADLSTVRWNNEIVQVWLEGDFRKKANSRYAATKELWKFKCAEETSFTASKIAYDGKGEIVASDAPIETRYDYEPIAPGTIGAEVMRLVCSTQ